MIQYRRNGKALDLLWSEPGKWTAFVGEVEVCEVEVTEDTIKEWARLCALDVVHLLPEGTKQYKGGLVAPLGMESWPNSQRYAWESARRAGLALLLLGHKWEAPWLRANDAANYAREAAEWHAGETAQGDEGRWRAVNETGAAIRATQRAHLHCLIWAAHGETLTTRERIELARDLRYRGEEEAAAAVLPPELKEVPR